VVDDYLSFFRRSHLRLEFPIVDSAIFQATINIAYGSGRDLGSLSDTEIAAAKASVMAFLSVVSTLESERRPTAVRVDAHAAALNAQHFLQSVIPPSMTTLQTALMLVC